jgi:exonuclease SbcD
MGFKILHFSDLHLDTSFAGVGMSSQLASKYREILREALVRIIDLAISERVDLVSSGGDLYEGERYTPQIGDFLRGEFERLGQTPVSLVPGNHDPLVRDSVYNQVKWPPNVHLVRSPQLSPFPLKGGLTIWSFAHLSYSQKEPPLRGVKTPAQGTHLLLMHGSDISSIPPGKEVHSPFKPKDIQEAGFSFALLGHYHRARLYPPQRPILAYPGSPEPLSFDKEGMHSVAIVEIEDGGVKCRLFPIGRFSFLKESLDLSQVGNHLQLRETLERWAAENEGKEKVIRLSLEGQLHSEIEVDFPLIEESLRERFFFLKLINHTYPAYDLSSLSQEQTVRGAFVRRLLQEGKGKEATDALIYGLQAFEGRQVRQR